VRWHATGNWSLLCLSKQSIRCWRIKCCSYTTRLGFKTCLSKTKTKTQQFQDQDQDWFPRPSPRLKTCLCFCVPYIISDKLCLYVCWCFVIKCCMWCALPFLPRCMKCRCGLAMRILSVRPSVCLSVCLSVRHTRGLWQNGRKIYPDLYTIQKIIYPSFLSRRMVGGGRPLLGEILGQPIPVGAKSPIFNQ